MDTAATTAGHAIPCIGGQNGPIHLPFRNHAGRAGALLRHGMALGQCLFNERHEGTRRAFALVRRPLGKTTHQLRRWQCPVLQHRADQSTLEFRSEHPFGRDGEAKTSEHCLTYALRSRDAHAAVDRHGRFGASFPESPHGSSAAHVVLDDFVCREVRGDFRLAVLFEVSGRTKHSPRALPDLSRRQGGVLKRTHA